ncbi:MAG: biliverdin-producing heme oxygenase [Hansschlegelia sp.]
MSEAETALAERTETRAQRLRRATTTFHETLDRRMSGADLFSSLERYALFLDIQRRFHAEIDALYRDPALAALVPDLAGRRRLDLIDQDIADIKIAVPRQEPDAVDPADQAAALGWLYVSEGSNLGAAFLLKEAVKLGLSETFGARHLAPDPAGRGLHWRQFVAALDAADLSPEQDERAETAASAAFARVRSHAEAVLA